MDHSILLDRDVRFVLVARACSVAPLEEKKHDWSRWIRVVSHDFVLHTLSLSSESNCANIQLPKLRSRRIAKVSPD